MPCLFSTGTPPPRLPPAYKRISIPTPPQATLYAAAYPSHVASLGGAMSCLLSSGASTPLHAFHQLTHAHSHFHRQPIFRPRTFCLLHYLEDPATSPINRHTHTPPRLPPAHPRKSTSPQATVFAATRLLSIACAGAAIPHLPTSLPSTPSTSTPTHTHIHTCTSTGNRFCRRVLSVCFMSRRAPVATPLNRDTHIPLLFPPAHPHPPISTSPQPTVYVGTRLLRVVSPGGAMLRLLFTGTFPFLHAFHRLTHAHSLPHLHRQPLLPPHASHMLHVQEGRCHASYLPEYTHPSTPFTGTLTHTYTQISADN